MARRKPKWLSDGSDSDSDNSDFGGQEDQFDPDDPDLAAERELFQNPYQRGAAANGRKRRRRDLDEDEDIDEGDWGNGRSKGKGKAKEKRTDYTKGQAFVSAGQKSSKAPTAVDNLSTSLAIEGAAQDEQDLAMDLDSDDDEPHNAGEGDDGSDGSGSDGGDDDRDQEEEEEEEEEDLAPVPGLGRRRKSPTPELEPEPQASLAFAPRGIGAGRGRGAIGSSSRPGLGRGNGTRAGIGGGTSSSAGIGARPAMSFAASTSASTNELGDIGRTESREMDTPRAGIGGGGIGMRAGIGGSAGIGSRPSSSLVDNLRRELASESVESTPGPSESASSSRAQSPAPIASTSSSSTTIIDPSQPKRSFLPTPANNTQSHLPKPGKISKAEQAHFAKLASSGSLGLKMLQKMGWKNGVGLGVNEQGIVTPIGEGQKIRKRGAGIAQGERSKGAIAEAARMRGEDPDEIEEAERSAAKAERAKKAAARKETWQQKQGGSGPGKKRVVPKIKTEYKTYEEIVAEQGAQPDGVGMLVDLSGNALAEQNISNLPAFGAGSADPTRLPELRHNLTLIASTAGTALSALAREGKGVEERRKYLSHEETRIRTTVEAHEAFIKQLEGITAAVEKIKVTEREIIDVMSAASEGLEPEALLRPFKDEFDELLGSFGDAYEELRLDEVVVGAIAPIVRRLFVSWDPLSSPTFAVREFKSLRRHFLVDKDLKTNIMQDLDVYGSGNYASNGPSARSNANRVMSAYETLMWTIWLPRVRSAINNSWSPSNPSAAVTLYTTWQPVLPAFIRDNVLDQLILPKVSKAISEWTPHSARRGGASLHTIVFPWLEHAGDRMEQILDEAKRRVRSWLKAWKPSDGVPAGMDAWKEAFAVADWDSLILKHVLPQLGTTLRETFTINPRQQDLKPLEDVLAWSPLLRSSMMSQLLEAGFFPKWLDALYLWLTSEPNFEQVAEWYSWWKSYFPDDILALSGVHRGYRKGLDLMNQAMALGDDAKFRLKRPDTSVPATSTSSSHKSKSRKPAGVSIASSATEEVSFRSIVEEMAASANLIFLATGKSHEKGQPLFRVSQNVDGRSGITVFLEDDVVWVSEGGSWKPVSVEEMIRRAQK